jgi:hypothetical protein
MPSSRETKSSVDGAVRLQLAGPRIIHREHGGETLVIDLASGSYFCLEGAGPTIWRAAVEGTPVDAICGAVAEAHPDTPPAALRHIVVSFLLRLRDEHLLVECDGAQVGAAAGDVVDGALDGAGTLTGASLPKLTKFTDLADLLLADPIHEVVPSPPVEGP